VAGAPHPPPSAATSPRKRGEVWRDEHGAVLVEVTVMMTIMFVFLLGAIEFLFAFYQWNAAAKAVQVGARIAAVSDPVAEGLNSLSVSAASFNATPGDPMPFFQITCDGASERCTCSTEGACPAQLRYDAAAMRTIVYGRGSTSCSDATSFYATGMCDIFSRIKPANVLIVYTQTGLGFADRPGGPAPTITVSLKDLPLQTFFLSGLFHFNPNMPPLTTSVTAEDLSSGAPAF
jgi:Flp pilus assembly pilin Flp